jgi:hypothetical protein
MTENSDNVNSYNFLFTKDSILLSGNILHANNKKGNCQLFMSQSTTGTLITLQHPLQPSLHVTEIQVPKKKQEYHFQ